MTGLRIAYVGSSTAPDGGSELCLLRMARYFHQRNPVTLFLPDEGPLFQHARASGIDTVSIDFLRLRRHRGTEWYRWWQSVRRARQELKSICRDRGITLLHFNDFIDLPFYSVARELEVPSVAHLRLILRNRWAVSVYRQRIRAAGCFVVPVSHRVAERMLGKRCRIPHRVVYDPAPDPDSFFPKPVLEPHHPFRLAMVSKLLENKGHRNFCRVALDLEKRKPGEFAFTMVAPSSPGREPYENEVRHMFEQLPPERARFLPGVDRQALGAILRESDLLLHLPDTEDSFPGVILEAMSCGTPVLAYRTGGIPEQLDGGKAGILVEPSDFATIVGEVEGLAEQEERWRSFAQAGIEKVSTDFSAETHFEELKRIYEDLLTVRFSERTPRSESPGSR